METMYPRVRVRVVPEEDFIDEQEEAKSSFNLLKVSGCLSPGKEIRSDSPPSIARVPKSYVPGSTTPLVPLCKGATKNKKVVEDSRPNIRASSVPRPRAVLSSPDNDGMIGKIKQLSQERSSLRKRHIPGANTWVSSRVSSSDVKAKILTDTKNNVKENIASKTNLKGKQKSRVHCIKPQV